MISLPSHFISLVGTCSTQFELFHLFIHQTDILRISAHKIKHSLMRIHVMKI